MAADFQESFGSSISFQADSLHSSISFGRFESEDLPWERRSSFSHNRYLEEVEKCSKPGSVIEKKAYFEAHFKKKGILLPGSFDGLNGRGCQNGENENDGHENLGQGEEDYILDGSCNYFHSEDDELLENVGFNGFDNGNDGGEFEYVHDENHHAHFDESPVGSEYHGECEVIECQKEDPVVLPSESRLEAAVDDADVLVKGVDEDVKPEEVHQIETMRDELHLNNDKQEMGMKYNLEANAANVDESSTEIDLSPKCGTTKDLDSTTAGHRQNLSPKSRASDESKSTKPRMKSLINGSQVQKILDNVTKTAARNQNIRERETPQRAKSEKQSSRAATPTRRVLHRAKNEENSESGNSRIHPVNKSEKEPRVKKFESPSSRSKRVEPIAHLSTNRTKQNASSINPDTRPSASTFSFKSDERAERRKELEEKWHAKEAEMNQIQAKTQQEKTEAEIKQFRKSLNFKATPMPSFYHVAVPPASNGNKASLSKTKPAKARHKSTSPASGAAARPQLLSRAGKDQALSANEFVKTTNQPEPSERTDHPPTKVSEALDTSPTNNSRHNPEALTKTGVTGKNERGGKVKDPNFKRHRVSENTKVPKDPKFEGKAKMGNHRSSSEMLRKSIKRIGSGSNSGMGHLAVGVAS
ncbi:protein WVD2-like 7 isoform X3 [Populus trichocarpa]|uniref:protein WVD2-like 7 isoform X3 n=1 Tax=Populus trichocarpa TaxID=3694 RepID=UPI002277CFB4|nr:protein WVD2-like 7 isoform X3 [Populus trichocarpa]